MILKYWISEVLSIL